MNARMNCARGTVAVQAPKLALVRSFPIVQRLGCEPLPRHGFACPALSVAVAGGGKGEELSHGRNTDRTQIIQHFPLARLPCGDDLLRCAGAGKNTQNIATFCHNSRLRVNSNGAARRSARRIGLKGSGLGVALSGDWKELWQFARENCHFFRGFPMCHDPALERLPRVSVFGSCGRGGRGARSLARD